MKIEYCVRDENKAFYKGDEVHIATRDGGGRSGTISHITCKGVYLDVGNKKDIYFRLTEIAEVIVRDDCF